MCVTSRRFFRRWTISASARASSLPARVTQRLPSKGPARVVDFRYLSDYHGLGSAVAWHGQVAMYVTAPSEWVIDNEPIEPPRQTLFSMYPLGFTRELAMRRGAFIYGNVMTKDETLPTLETMV